MLSISQGRMAEPATMETQSALPWMLCWLTKGSGVLELRLAMGAMSCQIHDQSQHLSTSAGRKVKRVGNGPSKTRIVDPCTNRPVGS